jgi:hypothetical protein
MSSEITGVLDTQLPLVFRIGVVVPALALAVLILTAPVYPGQSSRLSRSPLAFMLHPRKSPIDRPPSWAVICQRCGELDEPLPKRAHALQVGVLHLDLNPGHLTEVARLR